MDEFPNPLPPGSKVLSVPADMMDYLIQYWEIRDHSEVMSWSIRLLHDLTKLDEVGWRLAIVKAEVDEDTKKVSQDPAFNQLIFLLKWLAPRVDSYPRLPMPETLSQYLKIVK